MVTAVLTEFHYANSSSGGAMLYNGLNFQGFVWGKTLIAILAEILILFCNKNAYSCK